MVAIDSLVPWDGNPRVNDAAVGPVMRSMEAFGWTNPILARRKDRMIIAGHTRVKAARERGDQIVPVIFLSFTAAEARLYSIADNQLSSIATWDSAKRNAAMRDLLVLNMDLTLTGFDKGGLRVMTREGAGGDSFDARAALAEANKACRIERGQIWRLGDHRVMCGDSADSGDVARLMAGETATLMVTDPPYGVAYETEGDNPRWRKDALPIANDDLGDDQLAFWTSALVHWPLEGDVYVFCPSGPMIFPLAAAIAAAGIEHKQWLIWVKQQFVMGRSHYHYRHEHIFYGWKGKTSWSGSRKENSVWEVERPFNSPEHPTMKPLALVEAAIGNSSQPGDVVIDPFVGSGTTIVSAERHACICLAMEIQPIYVDVSIRRWEAETGQKAKLAT